MLNDGATALREFLTADLCLPREIGALRNAYRTARPFPHLVLDDLFRSPLLDRVVTEAPLMAANQWLNIEQEGLERIVRMRSALEMGAASRELVSLLHSPGFLYLLSEITDIWQLLPDPYLQGGGHALMRRDGYFKIHADRNVAYDTGLRRRLAMIVFLNRDWPSGYGGNLELWNHAGTRCEAAIGPVFNRTVLFEVAWPNYHGVPQPLACPPDRVRHSFIVYYHTAIGSDDRVSPHTSQFAPQFYRRRPSRLRRIAGQLAPPIMLRALRSLLKHARSLA